MVVLIDKIHLLNIPFLLLLSVFRFEIYYFSIQSILRNKKIIFLFDTLNLKFVNHSNKNLTFKKPKGLIMYQSTLKFKKIISSFRKKMFNNNLKYFFKYKVMFEVFFFKKFHKEFERLTFMNEFGLASKKNI